MLFVGFFEGLGSQRTIARCTDSLSLRESLGVPIGKDAAMEGLLHSDQFNSARMGLRLIANPEIWFQECG